jgi:CO/xanthine dehydrogenase Mo-binding subunit
MADALPGYIGQSVPRREDKHLLLGEGAFVADMQLPGMLHVRAPQTVLNLQSAARISAMSCRRSAACR